MSILVFFDVDILGRLSKQAEIVMTILPNSPDVEQANIGQNGLVSGAHEKLVFIDSSTLSPDVTCNVGRKFENPV